MKHLVKHLAPLILLTCVAANVAPDTDERTIIRPVDTGEALINPAMGWTMHFYSNIPANYGSKLEPSDTLEWFPGCSTVYLRLPWAFVEPEEGKFNWAVLDTPAQRWIAKGKRVAFRITCSENWMRFATPQWVKDAGAQGVFYEFGKGRKSSEPPWDPDFGDPVFLQKLDKFLAAMAARYDGNPNVAFVDIGSYGLWGEGHTLMSSKVAEEKAERIVRQHIDLHLKRFKKTLLCLNDDVIGPSRSGQRFPLTDYALSRGVTLRDDSILVQAPPRQWYHAELAQAFWPKMPVVLEHEHYGSSKKRGAWGNGAMLLQAVEQYHASYMSIHWWPREELEENREIIAQINRRLGYRLQLREISWPQKVVIGKPFSIDSKWANAGVAPCYPGGFMALTVKDKQDGIVSALVDEGFNMSELAVGPPGQAPVSSRRSQFRIGAFGPATNPGIYDLYVSIGSRDGTPEIALPLPHGDNQRRYKIGTITLAKEQ